MKSSVWRMHVVVCHKKKSYVVYDVLKKLRGVLFVGEFWIFSGVFRED